MAGDPLLRRVDRSYPAAVGMATPYALDAAREVAGETGRPVLVIASRRQVDSGPTGGYVGWTTTQWCAAVGGDDRVLLCRDHGGPYQHPRDILERVTPDVAMARALDSLRCDIEAGVHLLHVDTSLGAGGGAEAADTAQRRAVELVARCAEEADRLGRRVGFEVGYEVQAEEIAEPAEFAASLTGLLRDLRRACRRAPVFVVAQTGTKVVGDRNSGAITHRPDRAARLRRLADVVRAAGSRLKAHNCDYLGVSAVRSLRRAGAWMNISPEVGSAQTVAVLRAARARRLTGPVDAFCAATIESGHWRKWADGPPDAVPDAHRVVLGGAYMFATPVFADLRDRLDAALRPDGRCTRDVAVEAAKAVIRRYGG